MPSLVKEQLIAYIRNKENKLKYNSLYNKPDTVCFKNIMRSKTMLKLFDVKHNFSIDKASDVIISLFISFVSTM